ncbi:MAG TPA: ATP-binding protein, partial [Longimicrobiales bacterium]|nr:ATP-binding protein [Longimicrobiales bacterium]
MTLTGAHLMTPLVKRLRARDDSEHEQALLRIVIVAIVLGYMAVTYQPASGPNSTSHSEPALLWGLSISLALAFGIFIAICLWPASNVWRRAVGMVNDVSASSFCMFLAGEAGTSMIGVYLFITLGNGFRYGRAYLFVCQALCVGGLTAVLFLAPYWQAHLVAGVSMLVALIVIPFYVSTLLRRIQEATQRANEASKAKSLFLANMSHEIRTPLNGIFGIVDLLQTTNLDAQQTEFIRLLRHSAKILRSLVDDVLDISKIESGRVLISSADFDLHSTINDLVRTLQVNAKAKGIVLYSVIDPQVDYRVRGDRDHLQQILLNLASNAIKFTHRGEVVVELKLAGETTNTMRVRIEVRDTGVGVSLEAQRRIFDRFVQADDSTHRRYGGTGLGTTIAKQLVELMGGTIGLSSQVGVGSTFWFEIPLAKSAAGATQRTSAEGTALICAEAEIADSMRTRFGALCSRAEIFNSTANLLSRLRTLLEQDELITAVAVCAPAEDALSLFKAAVAELQTGTAALIYCMPPDIDRVSIARLQRIAGVSCVPRDASAHVLDNAIHAVRPSEAQG